MNSENDKKFSLDEMTDMYAPREEEMQNEVPMVVLTAEEWECLTETIYRMEAMTDELETLSRRLLWETEAKLEQMKNSANSLSREMQGHIKTLQAQTEQAFKQTQAEHARQVGKLNEEYTSLVQRTDKREKAMFWTSLICSLFPLALVFFWLALQG